MTAEPHPPFEFGYFPRHKYKDLVFYVKNPGEHTNYGLFEMEDNEENRAIMDALIPHTSAKSERDLETVCKAALKINSERFCPSIVDTHYHCCDIEACILEIFEELRKGEP